MCQIWTEVFSAKRELPVKRDNDRSAFKGAAFFEFPNEHDLRNVLKLGHSEKATKI